MKEYQKIPGPFMRDTAPGPNRNKLIEGEWSSPELDFLQHANWCWTEKVDGTNIRVHWDGHKVSYGGRTANAQIPARLLPKLDELFTEEIFEQTFQATEVTLYGEGYGAGIQSGGIYRPDQSFILFDVRIGDWWLKFQDMIGIGKSMGLDVVGYAMRGSIWEAIELVRKQPYSYLNPTARMEGLVGVTAPGLLSRSGERLMVKIKARDFQ